MPSRSPFAFQRRKRLRSLGWPSPRFSPAQSLVHQYVFTPDKSRAELIAGEGQPAPDRVVLNSWSPP